LPVDAVGLHITIHRATERAFARTITPRHVMRRDDRSLRDNQMLRDAHISLF
jgi:hypothetical protein